MPTIEDEIKRFLELHHRGAQRTEEERVEYEALRQRVTTALQTVSPAAPRPKIG